MVLWVAIRCLKPLAVREACGLVHVFTTMSSPAQQFSLSVTHFHHESPIQKMQQGGLRIYGARFHHDSKAHSKMQHGLLQTHVDCDSPAKPLGSTVFSPSHGDPIQKSSRTLVRLAKSVEYQWGIFKRNTSEMVYFGLFYLCDIFIISFL